MSVMVIGVPSGSTEVELRAVRDSAEHADGAADMVIIIPTSQKLPKQDSLPRFVKLKKVLAK